MELLSLCDHSILVIEVGVHDTLFSFVYEQFRSILNFFSNFCCRCNLFVWIVYKLVIDNIVWNSTVEYPSWFAANACMITSVVIQNCKRQVFMPLSVIFPTCLLRFVSRDACVPSSSPICRGRLVIAHLSVIHNICVISAIIVEVIAVLLTVISVVVKFACLVTMSMTTCATLIADASVRG